MKRAVIALLAALGGLVVLGFLFLLAMSWALLSPTPLPGNVVLELDLDEGIVERVPQDPFVLALERPRLTSRELVEGLEAAADDDRVSGLLVRGAAAPGGWGRTAELRDAVLHFRESGKPAVYFADTFGEFGGAQAAYYLASAFDEVILQPSGDLGLMPLVAEVPFLRGMLEDIDVEPRFDRRGEYKDASEIFTEREFTDPSREAAQALLESLLSTMVDGIAEGRGIAADSVRTLVRRGPFMATDARAAGLVDSLGYLDEARGRAEELADEEPERLEFRSYVERGGRGWDQGPRVALVFGTGAIQRGEESWNPLGGGNVLAAQAVARHLRSAVDDERVRAILFRVDSPGGSYVASDIVRRELLRAREAGKPVVVSMGDVAASGGYLISADADRIVAQPSTLTGSIGVVAGKFVTEDMWARLGIQWDRIEAGGGNTFYSMLEDFSPEEWERFQEHLDRVYDEFVQLVADGRGMSTAEVDQVARGRVWTGRDALDLGLVDRLGGYRVALAEVRTLLELEEDAPLQVALYPPERTFLELVMEDGWRMGVRMALGLDSGGPHALLRALRPVLSRAGALGLLGEESGLVRMQPLEVSGT